MSQLKTQWEEKQNGTRNTLNYLSGLADGLRMGEKMSKDERIGKLQTIRQRMNELNNQLKKQ